MSEWIEIGTIVSAQGLQGEVRVYPNTDFPERFLEAGERWILSPGQPEPQLVELLGGRYIPSKGLYVIELAGIEDREQAETLRDSKLLVPQTDRPHLEEDEFYLLDLIGLEVFDQSQGEVIGVVVSLVQAGNDLLEVKLNSPLVTEEVEVSPPPAVHPSRRKKPLPKRKPPRPPMVLIPFVMEIVPVVDLEKGRIEITPPPGLLPES